MRSENLGLQRARLLARWRDAAPAVGENLASAPAVSSLPRRSAPLRAVDEATLFSEFESEIRLVVTSELAEQLCALLAGPRAVFEAQRTSENRAKVLSVLDLIEDVLDAVVLALPKPADGTNPRETAP